MTIKPNICVYGRKSLFSIPILISILSGCVYTIKPIEPVSLNPNMRTYLASEGEMRVVHFLPRPVINVGYTTRPSETLTIEDPLMSIEEKFVERLERDFPSLKVKKNSQSRLNNSLEQFKRTYIRGLVLSFHTRTWELKPYWEGKILHHQLNYSVVARLIKVESLEILWQKECLYTESNPHGRATYADYTNNDSSLLKQKREEITQKCSAELMHDFMGI